MKNILRLGCLCALAIAVSGCGEQKKTQNKTEAAAGEILPRSVSDDMLPYDTVRSQPPLAPQTEAGGKFGQKTPSATESAGPGTESEAAVSASTSAIAADKGVPTQSGE